MVPKVLEIEEQGKLTAKEVLIEVGIDVG